MYPTPLRRYSSLYSTFRFGQRDSVTRQQLLPCRHPLETINSSSMSSTCIWRRGLAEWLPSWREGSGKEQDWMLVWVSWMFTMLQQMSSCRAEEQISREFRSAQGRRGQMNFLGYVPKVIGVAFQSTSLMPEPSRKRDISPPQGRVALILTWQGQDSHCSPRNELQATLSGRSTSQICPRPSWMTLPRLCMRTVTTSQQLSGQPSMRASYSVRRYSPELTKTLNLKGRWLLLETLRQTTLEEKESGRAVWQVWSRGRECPILMHLGVLAMQTLQGSMWEVKESRRQGCSLLSMKLFCTPSASFWYLAGMSASTSMVNCNWYRLSLLPFTARQIISMLSSTSISIRPSHENRMCWLSFSVRYFSQVGSATVREERVQMSPLISETVTTSCVLFWIFIFCSSDSRVRFILQKLYWCQDTSWVQSRKGDKQVDCWYSCQSQTRNQSFQEVAFAAGEGRAVMFRLQLWLGWGVKARSPPPSELSFIVTHQNLFFFLLHSSTPNLSLVDDWVICTYLTDISSLKTTISIGYPLMPSSAKNTPYFCSFSLREDSYLPSNSPISNPSSQTRVSSIWMFSTRSPRDEL